MDLSPLNAALDDLEKAVSGVAEKLSTAVTDDVGQEQVDALVSRVGGLAERLAGLAPATPAPASSEPAGPTTGTEPPATDQTSAQQPAPAWTPDHPSE